MTNKRSSIPTTAIYYLLLAALLAVFFELWRALELFYLRDFASPVPNGVLLRSFFVGWRFDFAIGSYLTLPLALLGLLPMLDIARNRFFRILNQVLLFIFALVAFFASMADFEFFRAFNQRLNGVAWQWTESPHMMLSMIWESYPVIRHILLLAVVLLFFWLAQRKLLKSLVLKRPPVKLWVNLISWPLLIGVLLLGARGRTEIKAPLNWGLAYFSEYDFANQLALNPNFTFARDVLSDASNYEQMDELISEVSEPHAAQTVAGMLGRPDSLSLTNGPAEYVTFEPENPDPPNVIIIVMESFGSSRIGVLDNLDSLDLTPNFDSLCGSRGVLFTNAYSTSFHTFPSLYSILYGLPSVPGKLLKKSIVIQNRFWGLPNILREHGYETLFFLGHDPHFDNMQGFLMSNGFMQVLSKDNFPDHPLGTWGLPDNVLFGHVVEELRRRKDERYFATIMSVSNHGPWLIPDVPYGALPEGTPKREELDAFKYSDWSLGQLLSQIIGDPDFANTLVIVTADNGALFQPKLDLDLTQFRIPLWFYDTQWEGGTPERNGRLASQMDILPTVMGLLRLDYENYSFGKNLFDTTTTAFDFAHFSEWLKVGLVKQDEYFIDRIGGEPSLFSQSHIESNLADSLPDVVTDYQRQARALYELGLLKLKEPRPRTIISASESR